MKAEVRIDDHKTVDGKELTFSQNDRHCITLHYVRSYELSCLSKLQESESGATTT